ncbi:MAG TPA: ABC transporter permease [Candidatus Ruminococcus avistercoris]|nr:ABC transporter permease [Candidatus Ruminococcus avistercoris]
MNRQAINTDKQSNNWVQNILSDRKRTLDAVTAIAAIIFVIILSIAVPNFLTINNIVNVLEQLTTIGMLCLGMTFILIIGGIDLSMPAVLMAATIPGAMFMSKTGNVFVGIIIIFGVGIIFGMINGVAIAKAKMIPFIVTLSTQIIANGFAVMITNSKSVFGLPDIFLFLGIKVGIVPISIPIFFVIAIISHIILSKTKYGRIFYMIGQNEKTARVSGIRTDLYVFCTYVIASIYACLAGILLAARTNMAGATMVGNTMLTDTISAAVIGGASLSGGKGNILGSVLGALFITVISNFINLMGYSYYVGLIIKGILIVVIIALDRLRNRD